VTFDAEILARQLGNLGRDLQGEVIHLGELEEEAVDAEGAYRRLEREHEIETARALLAADGSMELRKAQARLKCEAAEVLAEEASLDWARTKARVRTQNANLSAIGKRIEIGRSLLSREKALISLTNSGVDA
jgi:hypothetical protein